MQQTVEAHWSRRYDNGHDYRLATSNEISRFLNFVSDDAPRIALDVGCGTGQLSRELFHRGFRVVGIDASTSAVQTARSLSVCPPERLDYIHFDIEEDDLSLLPTSQFGLITCKLVYAFIQDKAGFLERAEKLLAPNGTLVVANPRLENASPSQHGIVPTAIEMELLSAFGRLTKYTENQLDYAVCRLSLEL